jgi:ATP-dependent RNA helicase SUPV3L1/SUV3
MGPLLVFLPELSRPVAVRLRGILLTLWQGKELPAELPKEGIVSFTVADKTIDKDYYRSIGYPVYGPRSIRVDMLDRVVCAVYDGAKDGKFKAEHKMAEWLGSNSLDLYAVLEAMGHTIVHDPAAKKAKEAETPTMEATPIEEVAAGGPSFAPEIIEGQQPIAVPVVAAEKAKPELATFRLKRGKANQSAAPSPERAKKTFEKKEKSFSKADKKPHGKKDNEKYAKKKDEGRPPKRDGRDDRDNREDRVYSSNPQKFEDSPFAILQQLKLGNDKKK